MVGGFFCFVSSYATSYLVKPGDTFVGIAHKLKVKVADLKAVNGALSDTQTLKPGMVLELPHTNATPLKTSSSIFGRKSNLKPVERMQTAKLVSFNTTEALAPIASKLLSAKKYIVQNSKSGRFYVYQKGDWDWTIARRLSISIHALRAANPKLDWTRLKIGDKISIPADAKPASPAVPSKAMVASNAHSAPVIRSRYVLVNGDRVAVRKDNSATASKVTVVNAGARGRVVDRDGEWYRLAFDSGREGWVKVSYLVATKAPSAPMVARRHKASDEVKNSYVARRIPTRDEVDEDEETPVRKVKSSKVRTRVAAVSPKVKTKPRWVASHTKAPAALSTQEEDSNAFAEAEAKVSTSNDSDDSDSPAPAKHKSSLIATATKMQGIRYRYGGMSSRGIDCSGFTSTVFARNGIRLPRTAQEQASKGKAVGKGELKAGDLVFFHTVRGRRVGHVGIYIGNGKFIHASSGAKKVKVSPLSGYYSRHYVGARRVN